MSDTKFTKGPWSCEYGLVIIGNVHYEFYSNHDANLIAAAPEMYEMLDILTDSPNPEDMYHILLESRQEIIELLAKARGEHGAA